jgi:hypothetical protein
VHPHLLQEHGHSGTMTCHVGHMVEITISSVVFASQ